MTTLRIPAEQPWQVSSPRQTRTVAQIVRVGWVWAQRALLALALIFFLVIGVLPRLGLYRPVTVLSGSMRPTFSPGDMVIDVPKPVSTVRVGQVISYQVPTGIHQVETHRIVKILHGGAHPVIQTRGDANNWPDPWTAKLEGDTAWRMVAVVPHLGYVVNFLRSGTLQRAAIFVAPTLLALLMLFEIWGAGDGERDGQEGAQSATRRPAGQAERVGFYPQPHAGLGSIPPIPLVQLHSRQL
jgi:signal peptidase